MTTLADLAAMDTRTCAVCGQTVAPALRGYMGSILACETHLREWNTSTARVDAFIAVVQGQGQMVGAFDEWAAEQHKETP